MRYFLQGVQVSGLLLKLHNVLIDMPYVRYTLVEKHLVEFSSVAMQRQDFKKTANGALRIILKIAKEASVPLPPAQAAFGAAVAVMEVSDVSTRSPESEICDITAWPDRYTTQTKKHSAS